MPDACRRVVASAALFLHATLGGTLPQLCHPCAATRPSAHALPALPHSHKRQPYGHTCCLTWLCCIAPQVFHSSVSQEEAGWKESLYRMYATGSASMRVAVYGAKHDAAPYEELLRQACAVQQLVSGVGGVKER